MNNIMTLRGLILSQYRTTTDFSNAIGWSRNKTGRILRGEQELSMSDIVDITLTLSIEDRELFDDIFFPQLSTKWTRVEKITSTNSGLYGG